jgi:hypothetical protein
LAGWAPRQVSPLGLRPHGTHDHRPPPHASWGYGFAPCRGGDSHPLSHAQPSGFAPRTLSASPNVWPRVPSGWIAVEGAYAPAPRLVPRQPGLPPARGSPGRRGEVAASLTSTSGPGANREEVPPHPTAPAPPGQGLLPKGTSISPLPSLPIACNQRLLKAHPLPVASPDNGGPDPSPSRPSPQANSPRSTPLNR